MQELIYCHLYFHYKQEKKTYYTPLHIAIKRSLTNTIEFLINNGSDVNAVADRDIMPLTLAEEINVINEDRNFILDLLLKR